ncbi:MAG: low-complexity tail membrane protein [Cyanobacteria bacterium J06638_20]
MRVVWSDPYVWLHLAGLAIVPLLLEICFVGLAVGDPILPVWLEFFLVAAVGIAPILWMQWQRPFCIFSVVALALAPGNLSDPRRRMLRLFRTSVNQVLAIATAIALAITLWQLYRFAPIAADLAPLSSRWQGLGLAAIAFFGVNLFTQVPVSVLRLLTVSDRQLAAQDPYSPERIPLDFVLFGLRLRHILPEPKVRPLSPPPAPTPSEPPEPPTLDGTEVSSESSDAAIPETISEAPESPIESEEQSTEAMVTEESIELEDTATAADTAEQSLVPPENTDSTTDVPEASAVEASEITEERSLSLTHEEDASPDLPITTESQANEETNEQSLATAADEDLTPDISEAIASEVTAAAKEQALDSMQDEAPTEEVTEASTSELAEEPVVPSPTQSDLTNEPETEPSEATETSPPGGDQDMNAPTTEA